MAKPERKSFFLKIDKIIFEKINQFKLNSSYRKLCDFLDQNDDDLNSLIYFSTVFLIIVVPLVLILLISSNTNKIQNKMAVNNHIIHLVNQLDNKNKTLNSNSRIYFTKKLIKNQNDFQNILNTYAQGMGVNTSQISINKINIKNSTSDLITTDVSIILNSFTTKSALDYLKTLIEKAKVNIYNIDITKNKNKINLKVDLLHYGLR
jgi:hypothetical protein